MPEPSQVRHPWRATGRTTLAALVGVAIAIAPHVALIDWTDRTILGLAVAAAALVTRAMADPRVEYGLRRALPWLAADPTIDDVVEDEARHRADRLDALSVDDILDRRGP